MKTETQTVDTVRRPIRGAQAPPLASDTPTLPSSLTNIAAHPTAVVYCEGNFAKIDGKTANGLVRHSEAYRIVSIIDSNHSGGDGGMVLDGAMNDIPIFGSLDAAVARETPVPDTFIYGMAPSTGRLSTVDRGVVLNAIARGMNIVSGLHEYLSDDTEIAQAALEKQVTIRDIRKPKLSKDMRLFDGSVADVHALRIAVLGTDCAIGKRTTCKFLLEACRKEDVAAEMIYTGQTGWMQGYPHGFIFDSTPNDFVSGELEKAILASAREKKPELLLLEGQSGLRNPSGPCGSELLLSSRAAGAILQICPGRTHFIDFEHLDHPIPPVEEEVALIRAYGVPVLALTLNPTGLSAEEATATAEALADSLEVPVIAPLEEGVQELLPVLRALL